MTSRFKIIDHRLNALQHDRFKLIFEGKKGTLNPKGQNLTPNTKTNIALLIIIITAAILSSIAVSALSNQHYQTQKNKNIQKKNKALISSQWNARYALTKEAKALNFAASTSYYNDKNYFEAAEHYYEVLKTFPYNIVANTGFSKCLYNYCKFHNQQCLKTYEYLEFTAALNTYRDPIICKMLEEVTDRLNGKL